MESTVGSYVFWGLTVVKIWLSLPWQARAASLGTPHARRLAKSQRKDDWLACFFLWLALITESPRFDVITRQENGQALSVIGFILSVLVYVIGSMVQMWLIRRNLQRSGAIRMPGR
ncbi:hypothetical protein GN316_19095 [Xylophilus sp. Kf1]|nr:hypothetical protein [Xylophilus sp. Kf1]